MPRSRMIQGPDLNQWQDIKDASLLEFAAQLAKAEPPLEEIERAQALRAALLAVILQALASAEASGHLPLALEEVGDGLDIVVWVGDPDLQDGHDDSSSVGGDGAVGGEDLASSGSGAPEPTEEAPTSSREAVVYEPLPVLRLSREAAGRVRCSVSWWTTHAMWSRGGRGEGRYRVRTAPGRRSCEYASPC